MGGKLSRSCQEIPGPFFPNMILNLKTTFPKSSGLVNLPIAYLEDSAANGCLQDSR